MIKEVIADISAWGGAGMYGLVSILIFALYLDSGNTDYYNLFWRLVIAGALCHIIAYISRATHFSPRPDKQPAKNFLEKIDASAFPSIHSARAASLAIIFMNFFSSPWASTTLLVAAITVPIMRVVLKRHYFVDVLFGFILGLASALVALWITGGFA